MGALIRSKQDTMDNYIECSI